MGAACAVEPTATVRHNGESHAQDVEEPHTGIAGCNEQALINATAIECHDNAAADTEHRFPAATGEDRPGLASLVIIGRTTATANRATCATTAAPRPWTIITAREITMETGAIPATTPCPPPLVAASTSAAEERSTPQAAGGHLRRPRLLDIGSRMLENRKLAKAMGFDGEARSYKFRGNKGEVTKQIGEAVPVHLAAARVRATLASRP